MSCAARSELISLQVASAPPNAEDVGPAYGWGDVGRLYRRYLQQGNPAVFNLSHALAGRQQAPALAQVCVGGGWQPAGGCAMPGGMLNEQLSSMLLVK